VTISGSFDDLVSEASTAAINGWDFTWLEGRSTEERPSWHYSGLVADQIQSSTTMLDLQSGGGEVLSRLPTLPPVTVATEGWKPNVDIVAARIRPRGAYVVAADTDRPYFPFPEATFDLVTSRHPVATCWEEVERVLRPGGMFLSQQVGPHSVGELTEFMMGPQPPTSSRDPQLAKTNAERAGLRVEILRSEQLRTVFNDVGAVTYFLRLVVWIVPGFTVDRYRDKLQELHELIVRDGPFVAHAARFLIRARKPGART
jgi:SAM-dependent methyltransferase